MHRTDMPAGAKKMFHSFVRAIFGFDPPQTTLTLVEHLAKYDIIKTKNECGEDRYIAVENESSEHLDILITKCKRLLSFVESHGLESRYAPMLTAFGDEIRRCAETGRDPEHLFETYEVIKRQIIGRSERSLSDLDVQHV